MYASRLWWLLRYAGHDAVALLDGGWAKWLREGRPTRSWARDPDSCDLRRRTSTRDASQRGRGRLASSNDPATLLVDARAPERYEGRTEPIDRVPGHIPGAVNHHYKSNAAGRFDVPPAGGAARAASTQLLDATRSVAGRDVLRLRRDRLPQSAGDGARRPARRTALSRILVRVVGRSGTPGRKRSLADVNAAPLRTPSKMAGGTYDAAPSV